ncbi:hypothetical protein SDC9_207807 [bioreactor metagenome]|uniref:Uncharacterized protein n=1 Tax=bioreactor metagenome TaxID=1076179 RepID=A0A645JIC5_9ZZZZ
MANDALFYLVALLKNLQDRAGLRIFSFLLHHGFMEIGIKHAVRRHLLKPAFIQAFHKLAVYKPHALYPGGIYAFRVLQCAIKVVQHGQ